MGSWLRAIGILWLVGLLVTVAGQAQEPRGDLGGQLFREDGRTPVADATLTAVHVASRASFQDTTDAQGRFLIRNVPTGDYEIRATVAGVTYTYTATVAVRPKALTRICLAQVPPEQALRLLEVTCETKPLFWPKYGKYVIIGGAAVAAATTGIIIAVTKEEVTPPRP